MVVKDWIFSTHKLSDHNHCNFRKDERTLRWVVWQHWKLQCSNYSERKQNERRRHAQAASKEACAGIPTMKCSSKLTRRAITFSICVLMYQKAIARSIRIRKHLITASRKYAQNTREEGSRNATQDWEPHYTSPHVTDTCVHFCTHVHVQASLVKKRSMSR